MFNYTIRLCFLVLLIQSNTESIHLTVGHCIFQYFEVCESSFIKFYALFYGDNNTHNTDLTAIDYKNPKIPQWIDLGKELKLIIPGYAETEKFEQVGNIAKAYWKKDIKNIIAIDWHELSTIPCYPAAVLNSKQAGECVTTFLLNLQKNYPSFNVTNTHLIGFSLGAHAAGFASNALEKTTSEKIHRITGLDPALPLFVRANINWKLDKSDADFVDVIHTNAGIYGKIEPCGHVDFYVNGGQLQPTCYEVENKPLCSHMMATTYFTESISTELGFWGVRCSTYFQYLFGFCGNYSLIKNEDRILMGENCSKSSYGVIFVYTKVETPFALGSDF